VEARRTTGGKSFEEAREEIRNRLYEEQVSSYRDAYIDELKKGALIEVKIPELKS
jgi:peptidyl-prolyl cis-trans isomerase SurA